MLNYAPQNTLVDPELVETRRSTPVDRHVILQVLPAMQSGGVERGTQDIGRALVEAGHTSLVASEGGAMVPWLEKQGSTHITLPLARKKFWTIMQNADRLTKLIKQHGVDLVHARSRAPAWSALLAARRCKVPFVTTFHGHYGHSNAIKRWYNSVMLRSDQVIAISEFIAHHIHDSYGIDESKLAVIPRGVDMTHFNPDAVSRERMIALIREWGLPDDRRVIFMPGRLTRWKGQHVLLKALKLLGDQGYFCIIAGEASGHEDYRRELEAFIMKEGLAGLVQIVDQTRDMPAAYTLSHVVVCPSTRPEAFGRIPVEAGAMRKPIVAAAHGGALETVQHEYTGWLVAPSSAEELADGIHTALNLSDEDREELGRMARLHVQEHFSLEQMCEKTLAIYDQLIEERKASTA